MANAPAPIGIAPRYQKPATFGGTDVSWRVLCDLYPAAETPEVIMAVVEYCATRRLDPLRKPCHVVPMWNAKLRRRVQVVMQGINELETTAHRTGLWAGMDMPVWGPLITKRFRGEAENDDGTKRATEIEVEFPEWCAVTVYRLVGNERRAFAEPVYWIEAYGRAGFRSEVPNSRWTQAPRQMLHKCAKSASLRVAFPEEGIGYAAEEMDGREIDAGGVTIEGRVDHGDGTLTTRDRQAGQAYGRPSPGEGGAGLDEPNGSLWLANLLALLARAETRQAVVDLRGDPRVAKALKDRKTPSLIKAQIEDALREAFNRFPDDTTEHTTPDWSADPVAELIAEVAEMDLVALNGLNTSAQWRAKVNATAMIPPDEDRLNEAIAARKATLQGRL